MAGSPQEGAGPERCEGAKCWLPSLVWGQFWAQLYYFFKTILGKAGVRKQRAPLHSQVHPAKLRTLWNWLRLWMSFEDTQSIRQWEGMKAGRVHRCTHSQCHIFLVSNMPPHFPKCFLSSGWRRNVAAAELLPRQTNERMWIRVGRTPSGQSYSDYCWQETGSILWQKRVIVRMCVDQDWNFPTLQTKAAYGSSSLLVSLSWAVRSCIHSISASICSNKSQDQVDNYACMLQGIRVTDIANYCGFFWRGSFMTVSCGYCLANG